MSDEFGELLRQLRRQAGLTQEDLGRRSGVSVSTIRGLETGKRSNPRMVTVQELSDALPLLPEERQKLVDAIVAQGGPRGTGPDGEPAGLDPVDGASDGDGDGASGAVPATATITDTDTDTDTAATPTPAVTQTTIAQTTFTQTADTAATVGTAATAEQLARLVAARWQREEEQRQIQDPFPLPVRWRAGPRPQTDHWANIRRLPPGDGAALGDDAAPLDLAGRLDGIAGTYRRIPSGRLVVLGRAGSGKTILTLRLVLDLLGTRIGAGPEPVPVIFSLGAWNPAVRTLRDWLAQQLTRDHPGYAARGPTGRSLAAELVDSGRVLPVLDGFDEIAEGLRRPALEALNATTLPLVLTSRPDEYAAAVALTDVLTSAAVIELSDLTLDDLVGYLPRTTRRSDAADPAANVWDPVLTALRERPHEPHVARVAAVLTTPLMVALARTVYSDSPDRDPAELLRSERFGSVHALEEHLLGSYVPTVYRPGPGRLPAGGRRRPFDPDRAANWLGYLARHLTALGTPDLGWWRLGSGLRCSTRSLVTGLVVALTVGLVDLAVDSAVHSFRTALVDGTAVGLLAGLMFGLAHWITFGVRNMAIRPAAVRLRVGGRREALTGGAPKGGGGERGAPKGGGGERGAPKGSEAERGAPKGGAGHRLVLGALCGSVFGFCYGLAVGAMWVHFFHVGLADGLRIGLDDGILFGLVFGVGTGLSYCLLGVLEAPLDLDSAVGPRSLLATDRRTVGTQMLVWAPFFGLVAGVGSYGAVVLLRGVMGPLVWSPLSSVVFGSLSGVGAALGYGFTLTAWGQWVIVARLWLPLTGRLPWNLMSFLDDAYRRGVLRQAGAVYQFRHARMQEHLARNHGAGSGLKGQG